MDEKNENIEGSFEELEDTAESYQEQKENLDKREESLSQAISILEQDTLIQKVIEVNVENLTAEQAEIENERSDALSNLELIRQELEQIENENDKSATVLKTLEALGEDVSEGNAVVDNRRAWLEECYRRIEELVTKLGGDYEAIGKFHSGSERISEDEDAKINEKNSVTGNLQSTEGGEPLAPSLKTSVNNKQKEHRALLAKGQQVDGIIDDIKRGTGITVTRTEAQSMLDSLHSYSGSNFSSIRWAYTAEGAPEHLVKELNALDSYVIQAPKWEGKIYRGINVSKEVAKKILKSESIDMLGPSSWSSDERVARSFADGPDGVRVVFVLPDNKSGTSITHLATYNGYESEVLAPSGILYTKGRVVKQKIEGKRYIYIHVQE